MARFTVIIPAWNRQAVVGRAIESVLSQTGGARCLVFDDGSNDQTAGIAEAAGAEVFRSPERVGQCAARNFFLDQVDTPYLKWLDSDDYLADSRVLLKEQEALEASGADLCTSPWIVHETVSGFRRLVTGKLPRQQIGSCLFRTRTFVDSEVRWDDESKSGGADLKLFSDVLESGSFNFTETDTASCVRVISRREASPNRYWTE